MFFVSISMLPCCLLKLFIPYPRCHYLQCSMVMEPPIDPWFRKVAGVCCVFVFDGFLACFVLVVWLNILVDLTLIYIAYIYIDIDIILLLYTCDRMIHQLLSFFNFMHPIKNLCSCSSPTSFVPTMFESFRLERCNCCRRWSEEVSMVGSTSQGDFSPVGGQPGEPEP